MSIVIVIKKLSVNHLFVFPETHEVPRKIKTINAQCNNTWVFPFLLGFAILSSYHMKGYHQFSSKFCICTDY